MINFQIFIVGCLLLCSCRPKLPTISICTDKEIVFTHKQPCFLVLGEACNSNNKLNSTIKYRGGSSVKFDKKSYTIELDKKISFGDIEKDDDWILNASFIDKTFMRHKISYELYEEMHANNQAAKCGYVNVIENNIDMGLYIVMEKINASNLTLNKKDSLAMLFKGPPIFFEERIIPQDSSNYYHQKYPKIQDKDQTQYLENFKDFLFNSSDSVFQLKLNSWIDVNNVLDWHLLLLLTNNSDGVMKNFYLYKLDSKTPFRIAIWDYDHSFGRDGDNEMNMMEREIDCSRSILLKRLLASSEYTTLLKDRWGVLRANGVFTQQNILQKIKENKQIIKPYLKQNSKLWPINSTWYFDDNNFDEEVDIIKRFLTLRFKQLDSRFN